MWCKYHLAFEREWCQEPETPKFNNAQVPETKQHCTCMIHAHLPCFTWRESISPCLNDCVSLPQLENNTHLVEIKLLFGLLLGLWGAKQQQQRAAVSSYPTIRINDKHTTRARCCQFLFFYCFSGQFCSHILQPTKCRSVPT